MEQNLTARKIAIVVLSSVEFPILKAHLPVILAAIGKHVTVDSDKVRVRIERGDMVSLLEIDIEIPTPVKHTREMRTTAVHLS